VTTPFRKRMQIPCGFNCEDKKKAEMYSKKFTEIGYKFVERIVILPDDKYFSTFLVARTKAQLTKLIKQYESAIKQG
jgi:hypothetical protein